MSNKYYSLQDFTNQTGPMVVHTEPELRIAPERVGDIGGDTVLHTKMGDIIVPEGAYAVDYDGESYRLV